MNFIISGKNIDVTPGLKDAIEQKLGKLERYFTPETEIIVTLSVEKDRQKIEVTIPVKGNITNWLPEARDILPLPVPAITLKKNFSNQKMTLL